MIARERAVEEGPEHFLDGNQEGIRRNDFEGGGGGRWSHVGKSNVAGTTYESRVENATLMVGA